MPTFSYISIVVSVRIGRFSQNGSHIYVCRASDFPFSPKRNLGLRQNFLLAHTLENELKIIPQAQELKKRAT